MKKKKYRFTTCGVYNWYSFPGPGCFLDFSFLTFQWSFLFFFPPVSTSTNQSQHTISSKKTLIQETLKSRFNLNSGLALMVFRTTRPWAFSDIRIQHGGSWDSTNLDWNTEKAVNEIDLMRMHLIFIRELAVDNNHFLGFRWLMAVFSTFQLLHFEGMTIV